MEMPAQYSRAVRLIGPVRLLGTPEYVPLSQRNLLNLKLRGVCWKCCKKFHGPCSVEVNTCKKCQRQHNEILPCPPPLKPNQKPLLENDVEDLYVLYENRQAMSRFKDRLNSKSEQETRFIWQPRLDHLILSTQNILKRESLVDDIGAKALCEVRMEIAEILELMAPQQRCQSNGKLPVAPKPKPRTMVPPKPKPRTQLPKSEDKKKEDTKLIDPVQESTHLQLSTKTPEMAKPGVSDLQLVSNEKSVELAESSMQGEEPPSSTDSKLAQLEKIEIHSVKQPIIPEPFELSPCSGSYETMASKADAENPSPFEDILTGNDENIETLKSEYSVDLDDAASSSATVPIAQACPNTLSTALRQLSNSSQDTLPISSESGSFSSIQESTSRPDEGAPNNDMNHDQEDKDDIFSHFQLYQRLNEASKVRVLTAEEWKNLCYYHGQLTQLQMCKITEAQLKKKIKNEVKQVNHVQLQSNPSLIEVKKKPLLQVPITTSMDTTRPAPHPVLTHLVDDIGAEVANEPPEVEPVEVDEDLIVEEKAAPCLDQVIEESAKSKLVEADKTPEDTKVEVEEEKPQEIIPEPIEEPVIEVSAPIDLLGDAPVESVQHDTVLELALIEPIQDLVDLISEPVQDIPEPAELVQVVPESAKPIFEPALIEPIKTAPFKPEVTKLPAIEENAQEVPKSKDIQTSQVSSTIIMILFQSFHLTAYKYTVRIIFDRGKLWPHSPTFITDPNADWSEKKTINENKNEKKTLSRFDNLANHISSPSNVDDSITLVTEMTYLNEFAELSTKSPISKSSKLWQSSNENGLTCLHSLEMAVLETSNSNSQSTLTCPTMIYPDNQVFPVNVDITKFNLKIRWKYIHYLNLCEYLYQYSTNTLQLS